ncbi:MAG: hypothetical protein PVG39_11935 [Desulfobacteraceae bacterium]|jgi:hypothetical protein
MNDKKGNISPDMTVLDIVSINRKTIEIFRSYDEQAGECICCTSLFESLDKMALKYGIDLDKLLYELNNAADIFENNKNHE